MTQTDDWFLNYALPHKRYGSIHSFNVKWSQNLKRKKTELLEIKPVLPDRFFATVVIVIAAVIVELYGSWTISSHENKKALSPFYHKNYFWKKMNVRNSMDV